MQNPRYELTISLNIVDHLGVNLYSNIPAVVAEVVANSWDADAELVKITISQEAGSIIIEDDGIGMSVEDIKSKYLQIGYKKRDAGTTTDKGRHVMGRKGIGKLSLFAIAETIQIESAKHNEMKAGLKLILKDIKEAAKENRNYYPEPINNPAENIKRGTKITLTNLKTKITASTISHLRRRLARRFSIIGNQYEFDVEVNDQLIGITDRDYFKKITYLWTIGDEEPYKSLAVNAKRHDSLNDKVEIEGISYQIKGWIGAFDTQQDIEEGNNSISILAWGKLIQEDLLSSIKAGGVYSKYLIGEIEADFLDDDSMDDIVTSDRQSLKEDDLRYECLLEWFKGVIRGVGSNWLKWSGDTATEDAQNIPAIKKWFELLNPDERQFANNLFSKIGTAIKDNKEASSEIYKHAIIAFERLRLKGTLSSINKLKDDSIEDLFRQSFASIDDLEAITYHEITKGRLEVIRAFETIVDTEKERVIQKYIFDHLWLLDSSWANSIVEKRMEEQIGATFKKITEKLPDEQKKCRIDIRYKNTAGQHIIIELKKYDARVKDIDLMDQLAKYRNALETCLADQFQQQNPIIEVFAVLGKPPYGNIQPQRLDEALKSLNARILTYDQLISKTQREYADYIKANAKTKEILEIIDEL